MGTASSGDASGTNGDNYMFLAGVRDVDDDLDTNKGNSDYRMDRTSVQNSNH